jgi:peptidyl-dipeptidase Dcp
LLNPAKRPSLPAKGGPDVTNPLLDDWTTPCAIAPFDRIEDAHFDPAFETALAQARAEIDAIARNPAPATFANTIEALECAGRPLDRVLRVFFTLAGADTNPERQRMQRDFSPRIAAFTSEIHANAALFDRVEAVWQARETLELSPDQARLLYLTRRRFVRAGAALTGAAETSPRTCWPTNRAGRWS